MNSRFCFRQNGRGVTLLALAILLLHQLVNSSSCLAQQPPNVVLILADDLGYGDLGCYGATKVKTPNIDALAKQGRRFTDAHSVSAVCTPSRFALLTGQYPFRVTGPRGGKGIWGPAPIDSGLLVDKEKLTIADVFKQAGYRTAAFGKWHLGFKDGKNDWQEPLRSGPQDIGFDYYFGMPVVNSAPPYVYVENDRIVGNDPSNPLTFLGRNAKGVSPITPIPPRAAQRTANVFGGAPEAHKIFNDYQVGTTIAKKSVEWIEEEKDKPFFMYLATTNIHHPFTPAKQFQGTSDCGLYGDFIHELDWIVGEVMGCLEKNGLSENTLVIFTSDNGGMFNRGGQDAFKAGHRQNGSLLGFKFGVWEGGHRVPFIARWPGKIPPGTTSTQLLGNVDMLATFAALTEQSFDAEQMADSIDMLPAFVDDPETSIRDHLILAPHKRTHLSVRKGKWIYIPNQGSGGFGGRKPGDHTFAGPPAASFVGSVNSDIENGKIQLNAPKAQLYDLHTDLNQTKNRHDDYPDVVKELSAIVAPFTFKSPKPVARKPKAGNRRAAPKTSKRSSKRSSSFDFESGKLLPWKVVEGEFGHPLGSRSNFFRSEQQYNKQGTFYLTTLESDPNAERGSDPQTGTIVSPLFIPEAGEMTFRVGGGRGDDTYVALCLADGRELKKASGLNAQTMYLTRWDLTAVAGQKVFLKVVDRSKKGWGHVTVDDFQFDGEVTEGYPRDEAVRHERKSNEPSKPKSKATGASSEASPVHASSNRQKINKHGSNNKFSAPSSPTARPRRNKPNILVIFADDLGYGDLSCYHADGVQTPVLDSLAADGFRSTDFFVPANVCSPSRAALLTGRYPMRCGIPVARHEIPNSKYSNYGLQPDEVTIPELLRPAGYQSLMVGKWHLGMEVQGSHPIDAGFDEHLGIPSNYGKNRGPNHNTLYRGKQVQQKNVACQTLTKLYTDEVVQFIDRQKDDPFFIYVSHHIVHSPLLPRKEFVGTSKKKRYGDFIKELDHSTGRILKAIHDAGLDENTLVVFTSDNGPTFAGSSGGLNGGKYTTMEGGHRVPAIFRWPAKIPRGVVSDVTLTSMDLLPLCCEIAGVKQPDDRKIDGKNILPILQGNETKSPHEYLYYYNGTNLQAIRRGNWKLHLPRTPTDQPFWNKRKMKGRVFVTLAEYHLYNLDTDLQEKQNVAEQNSAIVSDLLNQVKFVRTELGDVNTRGNDQKKIELVNPQER